eukprot:2334348-Amphidinium_carterae.1
MDAVCLLPHLGVSMHHAVIGSASVLLTSTAGSVDEGTTNSWHSSSVLRRSMRRAVVCAGQRCGA